MSYILFTFLGFIVGSLLASLVTLTYLNKHTYGDLVSNETEFYLNLDQKDKDLIDRGHIKRVSFWVIRTPREN